MESIVSRPEAWGKIGGILLVGMRMFTMNIFGWQCKEDVWGSFGIMRAKEIYREVCVGF